MKKSTDQGLIIIDIIPKYKPRIIAIIVSFFFLFATYMICFEILTENIQSDFILKIFAVVGLLSISINVFYLYWRLLGYEEIKLGNRYLHYKRKLWKLSYSSKYKKSKIEQIKIFVDKSHSEFQLKYLGESKTSIQFKYEKSKKNIGKQIDEKEGEILLIALKKWLSIT